LLFVYLRVKRAKNQLNFKIDKLTRSIENVASGESFSTEILSLSKADLKQITRKNGWLFNWKKEFSDPDKKVFKLVTVENLHVIQGLVSVKIKPGYVMMDLIESASFNLGKGKIYQGVAGNLVAYVCKLSLNSGGEGYVSFYAKTKLIDHYIKTLGAVHSGGGLMIIYPDKALQLVNHYFNS
jgi:hypothetical protein